jgi:hypothetical protein
MPNSRAADDFPAIRTRMEELRREREGADATGAKRATAQPAPRTVSDPLALSHYRRYRSIPEKLLANPEPCLPEWDLDRKWQ